MSDDRVLIDQSTPGMSNGVHITGPRTNPYNPIYVSFNQELLLLLKNIDNNLQILVDRPRM